MWQTLQTSLPLIEILRIQVGNGSKLSLMQSATKAVAHNCLVSSVFENVSFRSPKSIQADYPQLFRGQCDLETLNWEEELQSHRRKLKKRKN